MKILIIAAFYPPENAIAAQRPLSWAKAWSRAGAEVTVLTVQRDEATSARFSVPGVRLIAVKPHPLFSWLRKMYRTVRPGAIAGSASIVGSAERPTFFQKIFSALKRRGMLSSVRLPDIYDLWSCPAARAIGTEVFDVAISTFGPPAVFRIGWNLKSRGLAKSWILDFRDLWTENPSFIGFPLWRLFERRAENFYLKNADAVTTVSEPLANSLRSRSKVVRVFTNGFEGENSSTTVWTPNSRKKVIRYTGSHYWPFQDPTALFECLKARYDQGNQNVEIEFYGPDLSKIAEIAQRVGVSSLVRVFGPVPRDEALRLQRTADALLFLESPSNPGREGILTGKLFEYLAAAKPIVAVGVGRKSLAGSIITDADAGMCVEYDADKINEALQDIESATVRCSPRGLPARFSRDTIALDMLDFIQKIVPQPTSTD